MAQVDKNGIVTTKKKGTVVITAKATDGSGKEARCKITVVSLAQPKIKASVEKFNKKEIKITWNKVEGAYKYEVDGVSRSLVTNEIGRIDSALKRALHIMDNFYRATQDYGAVVSNDIEMILEAQSMAAHGEKNSKQSYKKYKIGDKSAKKSRVIKKRSK